MLKPAQGRAVSCCADVLLAPHHNHKSLPACRTCCTPTYDAPCRRRLELFGLDRNIRPGWVTMGKEISQSNFRPSVSQNEPV